MTELTLSTPSILFSAISLILLAYTNRFLSYAQVVRNLKAEHDKNPSTVTRLQLANLRQRLYLTRSMQIFGVSSLLLCVICTFLIYIGMQMAAVSTFGIALILLVISLGISIREVLISVKALELHLDSIEKMKTLTATTGREGIIDTPRGRAAANQQSGNSRRTGTSSGSREPKKQESGRASAPRKSAERKETSDSVSRKEEGDKPAEGAADTEGATGTGRSRSGRRRGGRRRTGGGSGSEGASEAGTDNTTGAATESHPESRTETAQE